VHRRSEIHLHELDHFPDARPHVMTVLRGSKMRDELPFVDSSDASPGIDPALRVLQRLPPDIRRKNLDIPRVRIGQSVRDGDGDRIGLLARGTSRAPHAQDSRVLPEFLYVQFRQYALFESFINLRIAEK